MEVRLTKDVCTSDCDANLCLMYVMEAVFLADNH